MRGSHGLSARRARRTKSRGPKGLQLEVGARRAPRLLFSIILHLLGQAIWGDIWRHTVEKRQTNATNVTMHPLREAIWGGFKILFLLLKLEKIISISLSRLESGESVFKFLFLFSKLENSISNFSVSSRKWWIFFHFLFLILKLEKRISLSLSLLESWESFFKFLFLFLKLGKGLSDFSFSSRNWRK